MIAYIDSSAILRRLLNQPNAFIRWNEVKSAGTSELSWVECCRTIDRLRLENKLTDSDVASLHTDLKSFFNQLKIFELSRDLLLAAASPQITILGTLDAIHLHTILLWKVTTQQEVILITHDNQLKDAALSRHIDVLF